MRNNGRKRWFVGGQALRGASGQAMIEYIITAAMLILSITVLSTLLYTFKQNSSRVMNLVGSEYP